MLPLVVHSGCGEDREIAERNLTWATTKAWRAGVAPGTARRRWNCTAIMFGRSTLAGRTHGTTSSSCAPRPHANVHELLRLMIKADRALTETELENMQARPVSRYAGVLARRGFLEFKAHPSGG